MIQTLENPRTAWRRHESSGLYLPEYPDARIEKPPVLDPEQHKMMMSVLSGQQTLNTQQGAGTSFGTYTTAKSVINPQALITLPAGYFYIGKTLRIRAQGGIGTLVTTPGTCVFQIKLGPTANIIAFTSGDIQLNATAHTNLPFDFEVILTCRAIGSGTSANLMGIARLHGVMFTRTAAQVDQVNIGDSMLVPVTAPAVGTGFDSTVANILDFWVGFSISNAANTVKIENYIIEDLN